LNDESHGSDENSLIPNGSLTWPGSVDSSSHGAGDFYQLLIGNLCEPTALQILEIGYKVVVGRRKFRSETSDNMDS